MKAAIRNADRKVYSTLHTTKVEQEILKRDFICDHKPNICFDFNMSKGMEHLLNGSIEDDTKRLLSRFLVSTRGIGEDIKVLLKSTPSSCVGVLEMRRTSAGNVMFRLHSKNCINIGIMGEVSLEDIKPDPLLNNRPTFTCFKGFVEHGKYKGVLVDVLRKTQLDTLSSLNIISETA